MLITGVETHTSADWQHPAVNTRKTIIFKSIYYEFFNVISADIQVHFIYSKQKSSL